MYVGRPGSMSNRTAAPVENVWTWLQEPGRPLSLPVAAPAAVGAPSTGDAGLAATSDAASPSWGLAAAVGAAAGAALLALDSRRRRANTRQ